MPPKKRAAAPPARSTTQGPSSDVEHSVRTFAGALPYRILHLLDVMDAEEFRHQTFESFRHHWGVDRCDFDNVGRNWAVDAVFKRFHHLLLVHSKDVYMAKMLLAQIFQNFGVDQDLKAGLEMLREQADAEVGFQESSLQHCGEMWEQYHSYRSDKALETRINHGADDLLYSLWMLEVEMCMESQSFLLHMVAAYFHLMDTITDMFELLEEPG